MLVSEKPGLDGQKKSRRGRAGMVHLDAVRQAQGLPPLLFGAALHLGEILRGNIGAADRLDFTAIGPAVNLVSRLEGLCRPLGRSVLISGAVAAETTTPLVSLGEHMLRSIAAPMLKAILAHDCGRNLHYIGLDHWRTKNFGQLSVIVSDKTGPDEGRCDGHRIAPGALGGIPDDLEPGRLSLGEWAPAGHQPSA
jgi:hypothetical protein